MPKIAILSTYGGFAGVAPKLMEEGNDVLLWVKNSFYPDIMEGLVPKAKNLVQIEEFKPDLILFDGTDFETEFKRFKDVPRINGNPEVTRLESEREYGLQVMLQHDILIPDTFPFPNIKNAIQFLNTEGKSDRWVFKQNELDLTGLTIVEKEEGQLVSQLERLIRHKAMPAGTSCMLQRVVKGIEIDFEAWVINGEVLFPLNVTVEQKKLIEGDLGPSTGASAAVSWADDPDKPSRIAKEGILKLAPFFKEHNFTGQAAFNSIVAGDKVYGLEMTVRPGINGTYLTWNLLKPPYGELLLKWATGKLKEVPVCLNKASVGVCFSMHPYPLETRKDEEAHKILKEVIQGTYITDVDSDLWKNPDLFFYDVKREEDEIVCAGEEGIIAYNAHIAPTVGLAQRAALLDAEHFKNVPNLVYKRDGISRISEVQSLVYSKMLAAMPPL